MAVASAGPYASLHLAPDIITTPDPPTTQFFTGRMPFLPPNQQRQSTEGGLGSDLSGNYGNHRLDGVRIGVIRRIRLNDPGGNAA